MVCIDHEIVNCCQLAGENLLLQRLETLGAGHEIKSQLFPSSIMWQRTCVQHDVQEGTLQVLLYVHNLGWGRLISMSVLLLEKLKEKEGIKKKKLVKRIWDYSKFCVSCILILSALFCVVIRL